ncbi:MAG: riboflavin biosynthesis protein RibF [Candidatus Neomarinimicrobiota bacterium]
MEIITSLKDFKKLSNSVITVGNYDGIHKGHHDVLSYIVEEGKKRNIPSCLITFDPNPFYVLSDKPDSINLQSLDEKLETLKEIGLDIVLIIPFDKEFSLMSAQMFADTVLKDLFNPTLISVGTNHYFGHKKEGDFEFLKAFCSDNNIELHTPVMREHKGSTISSSLIRSLILDGNSSKVYDYLGRFYGFNATVVSGSNRGKTMNYPTANFIPTFENQLLPSTGVYLTRVFLDGECYFGMMNAGVRPTFNEKKFVMEVHILSDKFGNLYDKNFYIEFLDKIRDEKKFDSKELLIKQIEKDKEVCIELIDTFKEKYEI